MPCSITVAYRGNAQRSPPAFLGISLPIISFIGYMDDLEVANIDVYEIINSKIIKAKIYSADVEKEIHFGNRLNYKIL